MVVFVCEEMEWSVNSMGLEAMFVRLCSLFRCLWLMGCGAYLASHWFQLEWPAQLKGATHSQKRTVPSGTLSSTVWEVVVRSSGGIQSGQYGSSSSNPSNILQRLPPHSPH